MRDNLRQHGWQYIVIDWAWYYPGSGTGSPNQDANLQPRLRMDANGRLLPDTDPVPVGQPAPTGSSRWPTTSTPPGLKFGVHLMRGIPRQAVADNVPILGTSCRANQINNNTTAAWLNLNVGPEHGQPVRAGVPGLGVPAAAPAGASTTSRSTTSPPRPTGRPRSTGTGWRSSAAAGRWCSASRPARRRWPAAPHVAANAHMWRIVNDLWDNWPALDALFDQLRDWTPYRSTGAWPDPDMIPIGRLSKQGPVGLAALLRPHRRRAAHADDAVVDHPRRR